MRYYYLFIVYDTNNYKRVEAKVQMMTINCTVITYDNIVIYCTLLVLTIQLTKRVPKINYIYPNSFS